MIARAVALSFGPITPNPERPGRSRPGATVRQSGAGNQQPYDNDEINTLQLIAKPLLLICWAALVTGCRPAAGTAAEPAAEASESAAPTCQPEGRLEADVYGAVEAAIRWSAADLKCEGMPRPGGAGARLRFAGPVAALGGSLAIIVALPELKRGETAAESPARITVIDEANGRFFSSAERESCWSNVERQEPQTGNEFYVDGIVYCVAPLAEVGGSSSVRFGDIAFSGRIDWTPE